MTDPDAPRAAGPSGDESLEPITSGRSELPPLRRFNVLAVFDDEDTARDAVLALERGGIDGHEVSTVGLSDDPHPGGDQGSERAAAEHEDIATVKQVSLEGFKGGFIGAVVGAVAAGIVVLIVAGFGVAFVAAAAGGAAAGVGVGSLMGAVGHTPASRSWPTALAETAEGRLVVGVHTEDRDTFDAGRGTLEGAGAATVRTVDQDGEPLR